MVSVSPRLRDSLDYEDPEETDPRLTWGFRSLSLQGSDYQHHDTIEDQRPLSASSDVSKARRNRRQILYDRQLHNHAPFSYRTVADCDSFRLVVIKPGSGNQPIDCNLIWESSRQPKRDYKCLSYCWQTTERDAAIICDGFRFRVTKNLLCALRCLRKPSNEVTIWIDQICINQDDLEERAQQVAVMKHIFTHCKLVIVWLGEADDHSAHLCDYAKKMKRGDDGARPSLTKILTPRQLESAIQHLLDRPWFSRVWVIPEVCLAPRIKIVIGNSHMSWENLIRLIRDVQLPQSNGFAKQTVLPGNPRQRIGILTQMISRQKESKAHTDISQLLILAKSSQATDIRDKVYAFYGMTVVSTTPDYIRSVESLYIEIAQDYINNIEAFYDGWRDLTDTQRTFQLMSILYSAGALNQRQTLPSWVPDWSFPWFLAPIWCRTTANMVESTKEEGKAGIRGEYRAGGSERDHFEIINAGARTKYLRLSAVIIDRITAIADEYDSLAPPEDNRISTVSEPVINPPQITNLIQYMRVCFRTAAGYVGVATQGIEVGDALAVFLGGDVPVILRPVTMNATDCRPFMLLCEAFVQSHSIMFGEYVRSGWTHAEDIVLV